MSEQSRKSVIIIYIFPGPELCLAVRALTSPAKCGARREKERLMLDKGRPRHLALSVTAPLIIVNKHKGKILGVLALSYDHLATAD